MANSLNVSLTDELRRYVDSRSSDNDVYSTPSEYIRDLIRRDMKNHATVQHVLNGIADIREGKLSNNSILDLAKE